jgi:hypothetical protein
MNAIIPLTQGKVAVVSAHRYEYLSWWAWYARKDKKNGVWYAERKDGRKTVSMHRQITNAPPDREVDHKDGDGLNNTDENLRVCTTSQNQANSRISSLNTSGFRGVSWNKRSGKWEAKIKHNGKRVYLGLFSDPKEAARMWDTAAFALRGNFARLNFPIQKLS